MSFLFGVEQGTWEQTKPAISSGQLDWLMHMTHFWYLHCSQVPCTVTYPKSNVTFAKECCRFAISHFLLFIEVLDFVVLTEFSYSYTPHTLGQGSTSFAILPSLMAEHGVLKLGEHGEHGEQGKDGKHQPGDLKYFIYDSWYSICDSKHSICQPGDSRHSKIGENRAKCRALQSGKPIPFGGHFIMKWPFA